MSSLLWLCFAIVCWYAGILAHQELRYMRDQDMHFVCHFVRVAYFLAAGLALLSAMRPVIGDLL